MNIEASLETVPSEVIARRLSWHLCDEAQAKVAFLIDLATLDQRKYALQAGYSSLWALLTKRFGMSEHRARRRVIAARLMSRFPQIAGYLLRAELELSGLCELRDVLEEATADDVLERARGLTTDQVKQLVVTIKPKPVPPDIVPSFRFETPALIDLAPPVAAPGSVMPLPRPPRVTPLDSTWSLFQLSAPREFFTELEEVKNLLAHAAPGARVHDVLVRALRALKAELMKKKIGAGRVIELPDQTKSGHYVPRPIARAVWHRDAGAFTATDGTCCGSKEQIEFQHMIPVARGGKTSVDNLEIHCRLCRARHKLHYADLRIMPRWLENQRISAVFLAG